MHGKQIKDNSIVKEKLNLIPSVVGKDPIIKSEYNARTINGYSLANNIVLNKADVGLGNVDNTPDADKPVSTLQKAFIDTKLPFGTVTQLRSNTDTAVTSYFINNKGKSGLFVYDATDTTSVDDGATVIVNGTKRFKRDVFEIYPEWWGAVPDGVTDCTLAIQKALDYASTHKGAEIKFSKGTYLISSTLTIKPFNPRSPGFYDPWNYHVSIKGAGIGITTLQGTYNFTGNLIEMNQGTFNFSGRESWVFISDMKINANGADRCLYANYIAGLRITDVYCTGGQIECLRFGSSEVGENTLNYSVYLTRVGFVAVTKDGNGGNSNGGIVCHGVLFMYIEGAEGDGGKYGIYLKNCSDSTIFGSKIEGCKKAALYLEANSGASIAKVFGNYFAAYGGYDVNGTHDGTMCGILIKGTYPFNNDISGNSFRVDEPALLNNNMFISGAVGLRPSATGDIITGLTSGAIGRLQAWIPSENRIQVYTTSGTFVEGEQFTHKQDGVDKGISGTIVTIVPNVTYSIKAEGGFGGSIIRGNNFATQTSYGIHLTADNYIVTGNEIGGKVGIYTNKPTAILANNFYCPGGTVFVNDGGLASTWMNYYLSGTAATGLINSENYMRSPIALGGGTSYTSGAGSLFYNTVDTTTHLERAFLKWNTNVFTIGVESAGTGVGRSLQIGAGGTSSTIYSGAGNDRVLFDVSNTSLALTPFRFKGGFTNSDATPRKFIAITPRIAQSGAASYNALFVGVFEETVGSNEKNLINLGTTSLIDGGGTFSSKFSVSNVGVVKLISVPLVNGVSMKALASANSATVATGATPTKTEFDALLTELRDLKTKMQTANLLT